MPLFNSNQPASITGKVIFGDHIYFSCFFYLPGVFHGDSLGIQKQKRKKNEDNRGVDESNIIGDASRNVITHDEAADALRGRFGVRVSYEPRQ